MIEAKIIADSISPTGDRITTFVCTFNRWILAELNTHRMLSRNSASSRAIPVEKMIERIRSQPAMPVSWGKNRKGMQATEELDEYERKSAELVWKDAMEDAIRNAERLLAYGVHKQIANRLLEPFAHMTSIVTATDWANFFALRCHPNAQPEMQELAYSMRNAFQLSEPSIVRIGEWHLPFIDEEEKQHHNLNELCLVSAGRCARVSYLQHSGVRDLTADINLSNRLINDGHWSPFEHLATPLETPAYCGNFYGWKQFRKMFANECVEESGR